MSSETQYYIDRYYALLHALRDQPELPPPLVLNVLSQAADFSRDWEEGKRIQRERGLDAVPPVTECEMGAGFWHRVIKPVPARRREKTNGQVTVRAHQAAVSLPELENQNPHS